MQQLQPICSIYKGVASNATGFQQISQTIDMSIFSNTHTEDMDMPMVWEICFIEIPLHLTHLFGLLRECYSE